MIALAYTSLLLAIIAGASAAYGHTQGRRLADVWVIVGNLQQQVREMAVHHASVLNSERNHYREVLAEERERIEHLSRLLDQYRAEGIQKPTFQDYGEETPGDLTPLPLAVTKWLEGLDEEVRDEYEGLIRAQVEKGRPADEVLLEMATIG